MHELESLIDGAEERWIAGLAAGPDKGAVGMTGVGPGDPAPDLGLVDFRGDPARLSSYWAESPALVIFWRHFGCGCGSDRAGRLAQERAALAEAGAGVVLVGMGDPARTGTVPWRKTSISSAACEPASSRTAYMSCGRRSTCRRQTC